MIYTPEHAFGVEELDFGLSRFSRFTILDNAPISILCDNIDL